MEGKLGLAMFTAGGLERQEDWGTLVMGFVLGQGFWADVGVGFGDMGLVICEISWARGAGPRLVLIEEVLSFQI